ncbi:MAG: GH25 family lysozyme [Spirochaetota bacterium]
MKYPSFGEYPIQGIDISRHQGLINWQKVRSEKYRFVYIKATEATEGSDYVDSQFKNNWKGAKSIGIAYGAYHFYRFCKTGREQAKNFISVVPKDKQSMPPAIDLEFVGNYATYKSVKVILKEVSDCIELIYKHYNKLPVIYATGYFHRKYLNNRFKSNRIWIRNIYFKPKLVNGKRWSFWQFSNRGRISGIKTYVDLNVYNGSKKEFIRFIH